MTIYKFGEVILVQFPFTDQATSKKRPAVVISSERYNKEQPDIILMAVTSQLRHAGKGIDATIRDWQKAIHNRLVLSLNCKRLQGAADARRTGTQTYSLYFKCLTTKQMRCPVNAY